VLGCSKKLQPAGELLCIKGLEMKLLLTPVLCVENKAKMKQCAARKTWANCEVEGIVESLVKTAGSRVTCP
jgi:hypothetical protein